MLTCEIQGVKQFSTDLSKLTSHYIERPFIDKHLVGRLRKALFRYMAKVFRTEGAASGKKWDDLSTTPHWSNEGLGYRAWKQKYAPGQTILRGVKRSGKGKSKTVTPSDRLYKSLTSKNKDHHSSVHGNPTGSVFWFGSEVPYAGYHDSNKPRSSNLPHRPILRLSKAMNMGLMRIIQKHVARGIKKTMGGSKGQAPLSSRITELMH